MLWFLLVVNISMGAITVKPCNNVPLPTLYIYVYVENIIWEYAIPII